MHAQACSHGATRETLSKTHAVFLPLLLASEDGGGQACYLCALCFPLLFFYIFIRGMNASFAGQDSGSSQKGTLFSGRGIVVQRAVY